MKRIIVIILLLLFGACAFWAFRSGEKDVKNTYEFFVAKKGKIRKMITATGTVEPITQVEVGTQVSGTISRLYADYNSVVKKGQLIAELDRTVLEAEYEGQLTVFKSNQNEYDYQKKNHERIKGLYAKELVSDSDYETAEYQYKKASEALDKSRFDLNKAKTNLNYCMIYSPVDGVVISRAVDEGQTVAAMFSTPRLFTIAEDLRQMRVIADIDEADIGQVREGQKVIFSVDAFPDEEFEGAVTQIRLEPIVTSNVVTYEVVIDAPNPDLKLKPGLTANVTVLISEKENVLLVPLRALRFEPEEEDLPEGSIATTGDLGGKVQKSVWLQVGQDLIPTNIRTGISDGIYVEILDGVKIGDQVVVGLQQDMKNTTGAKKKKGNPLMPNMTGERPH